MSQKLLTTAQLKKKADTLFSEYIRKRDKRCLRCGKTTSLQCAHIIGRRNHRLRYDPQNAITLCYACHIHWAHKEPLEFVEWLELRGGKRVKYLNEHKNEIEKRKNEDYVELVNALKAMIEGLGR